MKSLLLDRAKNGVAGAVSFAAMNMASVEISAAGEKITWDFGRKLVANSAVNGLLRRLQGGVISAEVNSVATDGSLTLDAHKIGTSIYEMGFVGGVLGTVSAAGGEFVKSEPSLKVAPEGEPPVASNQHVIEAHGLLNSVSSPSLLDTAKHFSSLDVAFESTLAAGSKFVDSPAVEMEHKYPLGDWRFTKVKRLW